MGKVKNLKQIEEELFERNEHFRNGAFKLIGKSDKSLKVITEDEHGLCEPILHNLFKGFKPGVVTAIDPTNYWLSMVKKVHGDKFDYRNVIYTNNKSLIKIGCPIHGEFIQTAQGHLSGRGCDKCRGESISKARRYGTVGWEKEVWTKAAKSSKNFDSFKFYILRLFKNEESFYKVGRTFTTIKGRFNSISFTGYKYEEILVTNSTNPDFIIAIESKIKKLLLKHPYIPSIPFDGRWECYSQIDIQEINEEIKRIKDSFVHDQKGL